MNIFNLNKLMKPRLCYYKMSYMIYSASMQEESSLENGEQDGKLILIWIMMDLIFS